MNNFKIITPVYNSEKWIKQCINSVKMQTYKNYEMVIIDACSTDDTYAVAKKEIENNSQFHIFKNDERECALKNTVDGINYLCKDDNDIIVILDGDDWLASSDVLEHLNQVYSDPNIWTTYGQFSLLSTNELCKLGDELWCKPLSKAYNRYTIGRFYFSHLRTYKYFLFKGIDDKDLKDSEGNYYTTSGDVVIALPLMEMAGVEHAKCIDKHMYVYNNNNPNNDMKVCKEKQRDIFNEIKHKDIYEIYPSKKRYSLTKTDILIWTKDRTMQLDLLLRSIKDHFKDYNNIYIRYDFTKPEFEQGYEKIKQTDYDLPLKFIRTPDSLEKDTKDIVNGMETYFMFALCDDDVIIRPLSFKYGILMSYKHDVCALSLRMSENIMWGYGFQKPFPLPEFIGCSEGCLKWEWAKAEAWTDWGYPAAVNNHLYKTKWYQNAIKDFTFETPNHLEYLFNTNRHLFKPYLLSFTETKVLNIPANRVQTMCPTNKSGLEYGYTTEELNKLWLEGKRISTENIYNKENRAVNEEVKFIFV